MRNYEIRKVQGLGPNDESLAIIIPKKYLTDMKVDKGDYMKISLDGKHIVLQKTGE